MSPPSPDITRSGALAAWQDFWFRPIRPHAYALLRILLGALACAKLLGLSDIGAFWALSGLVPSGDNGLGLKALVISAGLQQLAPYLLYAVTLAAFAAMTIGWRTNIAVPVALWMSVIELFWNHLPLSGEHSLTQSVLFCLVWTDCGSVWSVDGWLQSRRDPGGRVEPAQPIAPLRLIRFQVALIYASSGLWKLSSPLWRDGSALHYILNNNVHHRFPYALPESWEGILAALTWLTLAWEILFAPALLWKPARRLVLWMGVAIHLGMMALIEVGLFIPVTLACYLAFLDPETVAARGDALTRRVAAIVRNSSAPSIRTTHPG
jgi:vitamin K-dependent gamma-carboxylase-like protein